MPGSTQQTQVCGEMRMRREQLPYIGFFWFNHHSIPYMGKAWWHRGDATHITPVFFVQSSPAVCVGGLHLSMRPRDAATDRRFDHRWWLPPNPPF